MDETCPIYNLIKMLWAQSQRIFLDWTLFSILILTSWNSWSTVHYSTFFSEVFAFYLKNSISHEGYKVLQLCNKIIQWIITGLIHGKHRLQTFSPYFEQNWNKSDEKIETSGWTILLKMLLLNSAGQIEIYVVQVNRIMTETTLWHMIHYFNYW